jgi:hypothetical protein
LVEVAGEEREVGQVDVRVVFVVAEQPICVADGVEVGGEAADANAGTGIGFAESSDLFSSFPATFAGQSVDNTSILLRYTLLGDANFDRKVDLTDFTVLATNFNHTGRTFARGNFDDDVPGNVDLTDFTILAANFNRTLSSAGAESAPAAASGLRGTFGGRLSL